MNTRLSSDRAQLMRIVARRRAERLYDRELAALKLLTPAELAVAIEQLASEVAQELRHPVEAPKE
jgi:hypothetical protein